MSAARLHQSTSSPRASNSRRGARTACHSPRLPRPTLSTRLHRTSQAPSLTSRPALSLPRMSDPVFLTGKRAEAAAVLSLSGPRASAAAFFLALLSPPAGPGGRVPVLLLLLLLRSVGLRTHATNTTNRRGYRARSEPAERGSREATPSAEEVELSQKAGGTAPHRAPQGVGGGGLGEWEWSEPCRHPAAGFRARLLGSLLPWCGCGDS